MASNTTVLVTGSNKGIGSGLLSIFLLKPKTSVIAAIRDPNSSSSQALHSLPTGDGSQLILVKLESGSETDAKNAVETLRSNNISKLDVVMANAGIGKDFSTVLDTTAQEMKDHFDVNVLGPLILFQAMAPLLNAAENPKFMATSSSVGSIAGAIPYPSLSYGVSKAALNYLVMKIHVEHTNITTVALHPGWVQTEAGNFSAKAWGGSEAPLTLKQSTEGLVAQVDKATRSETSGKFVGYDGAIIPW